MARALWLPDVLRKAGRVVHEVPNWRTRGSDSFSPVAIVAHATAGSRTATPQAEINVLLNGSSTAPPPIAQLALDRAGHWYVVASGLCYHIGNANLPGTGRSGNGAAFGVEAMHDNRSEPWTDVQYDSYVKGVAAICRHQGWGTSRVFGHKEISYTGKTDPTFNMTNFRTAVSRILAGEDDDVQLNDKVTLNEGYIAKFPNDPGITDKSILVNTALGGSYIFSRENNDLLHALLKLHAGDSAEDVVAAIRAEGEATRAALAAKLAELAPELAQAVADQVDHDLDTASVEEALRTVLGGVDKPA